LVHFLSQPYSGWSAFHRGIHPLPSEKLAEEKTGRNNYAHDEIKVIAIGAKNE
jgi:hypothetical protein